MAAECQVGDALTLNMAGYREGARGKRCFKECDVGS
jgi:hypothetical protein